MGGNTNSRVDGLDIGTLGQPIGVWRNERQERMHRGGQDGYRRKIPGGKTGSLEGGWIGYRGFSRVRDDHL